jgi:hypothetical protein
MEPFLQAQAYLEQLKVYNEEPFLSHFRLHTTKSESHLFCGPSVQTTLKLDEQVPLADVWPPNLNRRNVNQQQKK